MHVGLIPPPEWLDTYAAARPYHLCLSSVIRRSSTAWRFYCEQAKKHPHVRITLDNAAHEHNAAEEFEALLTLLRHGFPATEVVLPDILFNARATLERSAAAAQTLGREFPHVHTMVVPQATNPVSWKENMRALVDRCNPTCIGISKDYEVWRNGLVDLVEEAMRYQREVHLLGWGRMLHQLVEVAKQYGSVVRSVDSAKPFVYALQGIALQRLTPRSNDYPPYPKRPPEYFDLLATAITPALNQLVRNNIAAFERAAEAADA